MLASRKGPGKPEASRPASRYNAKFDKDFSSEKSVFHCLFVSKRGDGGHHGRFQSREPSQGCKNVANHV